MAYDKKISKHSMHHIVGKKFMVVDLAWQISQILVSPSVHWLSRTSQVNSCRSRCCECLVDRYHRYSMYKSSHCGTNKGISCHTVGGCNVNGFNVMVDYCILYHSAGKFANVISYNRSWTIESLCDSNHKTLYILF